MEENKENQVIDVEIKDLKDKLEEKKASEKVEDEMQGANLVIKNKLNNSLANYYDSSIANNQDKIQKLTNKLVDAEMRVKEKQIEGQEQIMNSQTERKVTEEKSKEDEAKHERAKTVLKAQGLTEKLPKPFRITALIVGYPFFLLYLLTLGWVIEFITFVVKGFITMIYDCADRFAELNKKFIENGNDKQFSLGKAIFNILKWTLIVGAIITILIFIINK